MNRNAEAGPTDMDATGTTPGPKTPGALSKRLLALYVASFFQGLALWVPIEKLFMTSIGFTPASVGLMAAVYAVIVPVLELPSGILADRWSRRGVLILAVLAALISVVIGGLSNSIPVYMLSAAFLGVFFALQSGTFESIVYDTVLEETGDSEAFEATIGRVRVIESLALVASALAGGVIAQLASLQVTYFLTAPLLIISAAVLLLFREPRLHKAEESQSVREQVRTTYRTILSGGHIRLVVLLTIAGSLLMQGMFEFGPLWLVALLVPPFLYGPHWAGLTGALGVGGVLGARSWVTSRLGIWLLGIGVIVSGLVLVVSRDALVVVGVQVLLILLVVAVSIPVTRSLHDSVPSSIRAGVASGVGTLTWLCFVPFALLVGTISESAGIDKAGWLFVAVGVMAAVLMLLVLPRARAAPPHEVIVTVPEPAVDAAAFTPDRFVPADAPEWAGHWANPPTAWTAAGLPVDSAQSLDVARSAIADLPPRLRRVIVLRDIEGRSSDDVRHALGIGPAEQRERLQRARSLVRARLERYFDEKQAER